jgi:hypothetical protein
MPTDGVTYANIISRLGKNEEAVNLEQETLALKDEVLGPLHADTFRSVTALIDVFPGAGTV